ncbi:MAG: zinc ribbon domain-containing protein [Methanomicrobiales archaeon]
MTAEQRFCEECGKPLNPGIKFCEECGSPIVSMNNQVQAAAPPAVQGSPEIPLAVIPFAYQQRGIFSTDWCTLIVYPDQVIIAYVSKASENEYDQAVTDVEATLMERHLEGRNLWQVASGAGFSLLRLSWSPVDFCTADTVQEQKMLRSITIATRPWERYLSTAPGAVLAEDGRNKAIHRESISYIRGESDPSTRTDQVLIGSSAGVTRIFFDYGIYFLARRVLLSFLSPGPGTAENIVGFLPSASEPQVKGFGFQYTWIVVVTDQRVLFCMVEDDIADEMTAWIEAREKEANKAGRKWKEGELAGLPDAPWQQLMKKPVSALLENDVNFFIPLSAIRSVKLTPGGKRQGDKLSLVLPGESYDIVFPEGTADHIMTVLGTVLKGRIT